MTNTDKGSELKPPYVAYKTFTNFINGLRESGIPNRIDKSIMPGLSGGSQTYLLSALKFFGLINDAAAPTDRLKELVNDKANERAVLAKILKPGYDFILANGFNLTAATEAELLDKFREKDLNGETGRKCLSFFTSICEAAGIQLSNHLKSGKRSTSGNGSSTRRVRKRKESDDDFEEQPPEAPKSMQELLLAKFPEFDPSWDKEMQTKWFTAFQDFMKSATKADVAQ